MTNTVCQKLCKLAQDRKQVHALAIDFFLALQINEKVITLWSCLIPEHGLGFLQAHKNAFCVHLTTLLRSQTPAPSLTVSLTLFQYLLQPIKGNKRSHIRCKIKTFFLVLNNEAISSKLTTANLSNSHCVIPLNTPPHTHTHTPLILQSERKTLTNICVMRSVAKKITVPTLFPCYFFTVCF